MARERTEHKKHDENPIYHEDCLLRLERCKILILGLYSMAANFRRGGA